MDLPLPTDLLQNTSPYEDPATMSALSAAFTAQASQLATHHHQLTRLTSLTEELVTAMQNLQTSSADTSSASASPSLAPAPVLQTAASPRLALPEKFDGNPGKCKGFILQCSLFLNQQPSPHSTDVSKISFVSSLLTGRALDWITAVWRTDGSAFRSYDEFLRDFQAVFEHSKGGKGAEDLLLELAQGRTSAAEYALDFRTLAAQTNWTDNSLKVIFRRGLSHDLQTELACRDEGKDFNQFVHLAIQIDNLMRSRRPGSRSATSSRNLPLPRYYSHMTADSSEPMQINATRLTEEEKERRRSQRLCLYCGEAGHFRQNCPHRPINRDNAAVSLTLNCLNSKSCVTVPIEFFVNGKSSSTSALLDSGAAGNVMSLEFAELHKIPLIPCISPLSVEAVDGRPLGTGRVTHLSQELHMRTGLLHRELIQFYILQAPHTPIILGLPWLRKHDPLLQWTSGQIVSWGENCFSDCLSTIQPLTLRSIREHPDDAVLKCLPSMYHDLAEAFSRSKATKLPPHRSYDCAIDFLPNATPPKGRVFPLSQPETEAMQKYIEEELSKGFIRPSTSPASAGFFFVQKKDGGLRPCIDYRALNERTVKFRYPLPLVPAALEQLRKARFYTKLDLRSAYNLVRIREGDEWKTAFSTCTRHYEYLVMPFGLSISPAVFQSFINDVFRDMLNRQVVVYIDDIPIYSDTLEDHVQHVRAVLQRLIQYQLFAKIEKCDFHQTSISFLGYIISPGGVAMDEGKVKAVVEWPRPTTLKELQRFLGFANFYRRFIRGFSMVAEPLTALVRKGTSCLPWNEEATKAFSRLKQAFTSAPILHHPDPELPFVVEVDASSTGLGAVLSQRQGSPPKLYPCAYYSKKLSSAERNYDVGDRELLAMKAAFEEWRHWLEGSTHPFLVLTDHKNLEYLRTAKRLNPRQARWSLFFSRFQFTITFRPGSKNTKADSLSRQFDSETSITNPETILSPDLVIGPIQWDIETELELANAHTGIHPECPPGKLYVPETLREKVLKHVHALPSSGHPGITATIHLLQNRFWWSTLSQDVSRFVQQCKTCNIQKSSRLLPAGLLQPLPLPQRPWSHIAIDFITDLPPSDGHTTILTVIDRFSKACRLIPLSKLPTALQTAEYLCNLVFRFYGLPEDIVSDRGAQFTSRVWSAFFQMLQVNVSLTSGYHPQANGQVERLNQEVSRFLRSYCQLHQKDWSRYLMWAEYAQNSIQKQSTGLTPFQCVLGFQPPLFPWSGEPTNVPAVNDWLNRSEETWNLAHTHLQRAVNRGKRQADRHRRSNPEYLPGQWVWLSTRNLRLNLPCKKLSPRFVGPYKILRQITPVSFRLALPRHLCISPTFHVSLLKPATPPTEEERGDSSRPSSQSNAVQTSQAIVVEGEEAYRVHQLLDSRRRGGHLQYLVDWEGCSPEERSWVNSRDILDPMLTQEFHCNHPEKPAPRARGRPRRRQHPLAGSRSQGGGSVTASSFPDSSISQSRAPSPEF